MSKAKAMGQNKRMIEEAEAVDREAVAIAVEVGWLEICDDHGTLSVNDPSKKSHAYAKANWLVTNGRTQTDRESLRAGLDRAELNSGYDCAICADFAADDD